MRAVLAIDPGREKCGLAVVATEGVLHKQVAPQGDIVRVACALAAKYSAERILVGNGTGGGSLVENLRRAATGISIELVDETNSTRKARSRFFEDNPPKGIRRLIPRGLLVPDRPYDDYVAVLLGENYLKQE